MTTPELIKYYTDLLILQYKGKPRANATVAVLAGLAVMDQLPKKVQDAFALDSAIGVQLDVLGKYVGVSRYVYDFTGPVTLNDADFFTLINIAIISNNAGSSLGTIKAFLFNYFSTALQIFDHLQMRLDYYFDATQGTQQFAEILIRGGFVPRPMAVALGAFIYSVHVNSFFGFRTYLAPGVNNTPFNTYASYQTDQPWLSYADNLNV